ncbi:hypothetical protein BIU98_11845 [Curtobacterium sp. MMLR14_010]|uniref:hypothetical protein n=1 Tax=Curtobacterium sp. MMLR14_010 TaxID=1898743 RepID=UPI0008DC6F1D|nr:hypothetical protein [Curtobacterium sp. MMLR14_010]OII39713.1 hypothetical protein BIU98_11845 [Curtobacterium sp. MMLR14_010]
MKKKFGNRSALMAVSAMVGALGLLFTAAPAQATTTTLTGTIQHCSEATAYGAARTNSYSRNAVSFRATNVGPCGGDLTIALRNSSGKTFARGTAGSGKSVAVKSDTGTYWVTPGTFYINASSNGACGSSTCAAGKSWAASFSYNLQWTP